MPPTTHGTVSPGQPPRPYLLLPILYYKLCPRPRSRCGHPPVTSPLTASSGTTLSAVHSPTHHQPQWPPILDPHSTTTISSLQMQMNPPDPLPVKPLTLVHPPCTLQEDLLSVEPSTTMELPARIGQMGTPPLRQPYFVECTCLRFVL